MSEWSRSEIEEEILTLEDAALLADSTGQIPEETLTRVRRLVRSDPRIQSHYEYLEALADAAGLSAAEDRLHVGLRCLEEIERLAQAEDWQHPAEVLDPTGEVGISYPELVQLAAMQERQASEPERYQEVQRRLEEAWSEEKAGEALVERFAQRLCDHQPSAAERLLRQAARQYQARRREEALTP